MRYYISDLHLFHSAMDERMDKRGFGSTEAMHEYVIKQWNSKVRKNDEVIILGDFSIGKAQETEEIIKQLNGRKYLITGNHDWFLKDNKFDKNLFVWIKPYSELNDDKRKIILSHYPIMCYNGQYRRDGEGQAKTYMLYGHVHNTYDEVLVNEHINKLKSVERQIYRGNKGIVTETIPCQMINCFCMFSDYTPMTLDEWIDIDNKRRKAMNNEN